MVNRGRELQALVGEERTNWRGGRGVNVDCEAPFSNTGKFQGKKYQRKMGSGHGRVLNV